MNLLRTRTYVLTLTLLIGAGSLRADELELSQPRGFAPRAGEVETAVDQPALPAAPASNEAAIPLAPRKNGGDRELAAPRMPGSTTTITTVVTSLAIVLGLFFVLAWFMRRHLPKAMTQLPKEVLEPLGRAPLAGKQQMHLVRIGHKLLLVVVTPFGAETLTEITDPEEVDRLCGLCRATSGHGPSAEFRAVLQQFEREPAEPGFLGNPITAPRTARARGNSHA